MGVLFICCCCCCFYIWHVCILVIKMMVTSHVFYLKFPSLSGIKVLYRYILFSGINICSKVHQWSLRSNFMGFNVLTLEKIHKTHPWTYCCHKYLYLIFLFFSEGGIWASLYGQRTQIWDLTRFCFSLCLCFRSGPIRVANKIVASRADHHGRAGLHGWRLRWAHSAQETHQPSEDFQEPPRSPPRTPYESEEVSLQEVSSIFFISIRFLSFFSAWH